MNEAFDPALERLELPAPAGGSVTFTREGPPGGPPVLCVHGVPGNVRDWRYLAPRLAEQGFEVFRVDMPGYGGTDRAVWPQNELRARASFVALVAKTLGLARPILAGHSMGCPPCLLAASWYPENIGGLLLVNTPGIERHRGLQFPEQLHGLLGKLVDAPVLGDRIHAEARSGYRRAGFRQADIDALDKDALRQTFEIIGGLDFAALRAAARSVRCPVLVASAADDKLIEPEITHSLVDAIHARCVHVQYAKGGHYLQKHEAPDLAARSAALFPRARDRWVYGTVSGAGV